MDKVLETLKLQRQKKGLSQAVVARRLNMVTSAYSKIERGQTELTLNRLHQISKVIELNEFDISKIFIQMQEAPTQNKYQKFQDMSIESELDLSQKINYMFSHFINSMVYDKYRDIMSEYPCEEVSAEEWWESLGDNKEEQLGMSEAEYWDMYGGSYSEIFKPEHEYEGFKKLMQDYSMFYFFKFGLADDYILNPLFSRYITEEDTQRYPLKSKLDFSVVSDYLKSLENVEAFQRQKITFENLINNTYD